MFSNNIKLIYYFKIVIRSKRRGFHYYVQGMMKEISKAYAVEIKKMDMVMKKQEVL